MSITSIEDRTMDVLQPKGRPPRSLSGILGGAVHRLPYKLGRFREQDNA